MFVGYTTIGHYEKRAELWAWAPGHGMWRASTLYGCYGPKVDGMNGPCHYDVLASTYYQNVPLSWANCRGYIQGRVSHQDKRVSIGSTTATDRQEEYVIKLLCRTWPGYEIFKDGYPVKASAEEATLFDEAAVA